MRAGEHRAPSARALASACTFKRWPATVRAVVGGDDRFSPPDLQVRIARERLGIEPVVIPGGHLVATSRPAGLVDALLSAD